MTDIGRLRLVDLASAHGVHGEHDIMVVLLVADLLDDREAGADADRAVELVERARSSTQRASDSGGHTSRLTSRTCAECAQESKGAGRGAEATPRASHASHAELLATNDERLDTGHARPATAPE
eukprot:SAG25_NODE_1013_length_4299_cov_1.754286_5_plen_124_part_00